MLEQLLFQVHHMKPRCRGDCIRIVSGLSHRQLLFHASELYRGTPVYIGLDCSSVNRQCKCYVWYISYYYMQQQFLAAGNALSCSSVMYTYKGNSITYNLLYRRWPRLFICRPISIITAVLLGNHCHISIKKLTKFVDLLNNPFSLFLILLDLRFKSLIAMVKAGGVLNLRASPREPRLESLVWSWRPNVRQQRSLQRSRFSSGNHVPLLESLSGDSE
jgi:hypothetical protein